MRPCDGGLLLCARPCIFRGRPSSLLTLDIRFRPLQSKRDWCTFKSLPGLRQTNGEGLAELTLSRIVCEKIQEDSRTPAHVLAVATARSAKVEVAIYLK